MDAHPCIQTVVDDVAGARATKVMTKSISI